MKIKLTRFAFLLGIIIVASLPASAQQPPAFFDAFLFDNAGQPANDFNLFFQWNVTDGTVDLSGGNVPGADEPPAGRLVDLDGGDAGAFATKTQFVFLAGQTYNLSFRYLSTDGNANAATATIGSQVFNFGTSANVFQTYSMDFTFPATTTANLVFQDAGSDDFGVGIDRVMLSPVAPQEVAPQGILISEYRLRGTSGAQDEFIEIYNNTDTEIVVTDSSPVQDLATDGWAVVSGDDPLTPKFTIPVGTRLPARGHFLVANGIGYTLGLHPAGNDGDEATTAIEDGTYFVDIPDNRGVAIFNTANPLVFSPATRFDAVGSAVEVNPLFKEGSGHAPVSVANIEFSFYRDLRSGLPQDTNDNAADVLFVDTTATNTGAGARLGAPGPENLTSPVQRNATIKASLVDFGCSGAGAAASACARVRSAAGANPANAAFGTLAIRRKFTNKTGASITRLRFRVVNISTAPEASGADLRVVGGTGSFDANLSGGGTATIQRLTLETPPAQTIGGGFNSNVSAGTITLQTPLADGAPLNVEFLLGVQRDGNFSFLVNVEALTAPAPIAPEAVNGKLGHRKNSLKAASRK